MLLNIPYNGLAKVISGGQDGSDLGGLTAALNFGIPTGGHCPRFCRTASGPNLELISKFGLEETTATNYQKRTELNVKNSDGTIIFAHDMQSPGTQLTLRLLEKYNRPYLTIQLPNLEMCDIIFISQWLEEEQISVLNVAGNRDKDCRRGKNFDETYNILSAVFKYNEEKQYAT